MRLLLPLFCILLVMMIGGCNVTTDKAEQQFKEAEELWMEGQFESAKDKYKQLIANFSKSDFYDDAIFRLGELYYLNLNDNKKALYYFDLLIYSSLKSEYKYKSHRYLASIYDNSLSDYNKTIIEYQRLIDNYDIDDEDDIFQSKIANSYFKKGNYQQAIVEFSNLIERYPDSELIDYGYYQISNIYYIIEKYEEAKASYLKIIEKFPHSQYAVEAKLGIGECLDEQGELKKALKIYLELIETYPNKQLINNKINGIKKRIKK